MRNFLIPLVAGLFLSIATVSPVNAEPTADEKLQLKAIVSDFINSKTNNGEYAYVNTDSLEGKSLTFLAMHPVVFESDGGIFVLCADFEDAKGEKFLIDYFVKEIGGKFRVISEINGKRSLLKKVAEKFKL